MNVINLSDYEAREEKINAWFEWDDDDTGGLSFRIKDITSDESKNLLKKCTVIKTEKKTWREKGQNKMLNTLTDNIDFEKFNRLLIKTCVIDWRNLKNKHLKDVLNVSKFKFPKDAKKEEEIKFNEANLEAFSKIASNDFLDFLGHARDELKNIQKSNIENELKN